MKAPRISEKQEQRAIVDLLRLIGAKVYVIGRTPPRDGRTHFGTGQTPGIPDLYAFLPDRMHQTVGICDLPIWIEVKAKDGVASEAQKAFASLAFRSNHFYFRGTADGFTAYLRSLGFRIG